MNEASRSHLNVGLSLGMCYMIGRYLLRFGGLLAAILVILSKVTAVYWSRDDIADLLFWLAIALAISVAIALMYRNAGSRSD